MSSMDRDSFRGMLLYQVPGKLYLANMSSLLWLHYLMTFNYMYLMIFSSAYVFLYPLYTSAVIRLFCVESSFCFSVVLDDKMCVYPYICQKQQPGFWILTANKKMHILKDGKLFALVRNISKISFQHMFLREKKTNNSRYFLSF